MLAPSHQTPDRGSSIHHYSPFQSATARTSSMPPKLHLKQEFSGRRGKAFAKKVHWASDVRDNDKDSNQPRSMIKNSRSLSMKLSSPSLHQPPTPSNSAKIVRRSVSRDSGDLASPSLSNMSKLIDPVHCRALDETIPKRRPRSSSSTLQSEVHVTSVKPSTQSRVYQTRDIQRRTGSSEVRTSANSSYKRSSSSAKQRSHRLTELLPQVPDAPGFARAALATPRPPRLPTPDLDDLSDRHFCYCDNSMCRHYSDVQDSWDGGLTSKMSAQLQAAQEYINSRRN